MRLLRLERSKQLIADLAARGSADTSRVEPVVRKILQDIRRGGDRSLRRYTQQLDKVPTGTPLRVTPQEMKAAWDSCDAAFRDALKSAAKNIEQFCRWQMPKSWRRRISEGIELGQLVRPIASVGCYVPGGRYPLPSSVLMTVLPARVAGVSRIVVTSPKPAPQTLAAAHFLGVEEFYRVGGAQAIGALAYGTETIEGVAKIVGPGNIYVTTAKKLVAFDCAIDMLAGPTEAVIVSDLGNPRLLAADLVAQAEHDPETFVALFTTSPKLANAVLREVNELARGNSIADAALSKRGYVFLARDLGQAMEAANQIAAEHLTVDNDLLGSIENAGSVFVGDYAAQAFGDYATGPNHVLPTGALARVRGGLSVLDYLKIITVQNVTRKGAKTLSATAATLARAEGLKAHQRSAELRSSNA